MSAGSMTTGWWYTYPSEKHEFVNGKDDIPYIVENNKLVGGFNPSEKYESQLGSLFQAYGTRKFMFQTTNQYIYIYLYHNWFVVFCDPKNDGLRRLRDFVSWDHGK